MRAAAEVTALFPERSADPLEHVDYRLAETEEERDEIYRLRYRAYLREGAILPSESQRVAIEATPQPLLVLAGPGAGKTFCLIERIRYLIERLEVEPARICVFTFTNKAAGYQGSSRHGRSAQLVEITTFDVFN